ncbi:MAG: DUF1801 domain-containing protein [Acetobacterium woodii]|nr:DUF1801 domain-containing protein [Acetobacterium woodii]
MKPQKPNTIDDYIEVFPETVQEKLRQLRETIQAAAPEATEKISYQMPTFYLNGNLVHFAAFKNHIGFYPTPSAIEQFKEALSVYQQGKGSVQFPINEALPLDLITEMVKARVFENQSKAEAKNHYPAKKNKNFEHQAATKEKLIILGTGNAAVTKCYNTCFAIQKNEEFFLVDTGGGNGILTQLEKAEISLDQIHEIFISHEHTDHLLGIIWLIRMISARMKSGSYQGNLNIYCHTELKKTIVIIVKLTIPDKFVKMIGDRILFHQVKDGKVREILGYPVTFFDIRSTKAKQFGFSLKLESGKKLVFLGDEPYREHEYDYAYQADWLLHEAFCRYADRDQFLPYEKDHTTVKEACEIAETLEVANLILYHTEDSNLAKRAVLYQQEGSGYYQGNLYVPDDLAVFDL